VDIPASSSSLLIARSEPDKSEGLPAISLDLWANWFRKGRTIAEIQLIPCTQRHEAGDLALTMPWKKRLKDCTEEISNHAGDRLSLPTTSFTFH
jgi:hypothetical protein